MCCNCFYSLSFSILKIFLAPFQERKQKNCLPHDGPFLKKVKSQFFSIASIDTFRVNLTFNALHYRFIYLKTNSGFYSLCVGSSIAKHYCCSSKFGSQHGKVERHLLLILCNTCQNASPPLPAVHIMYSL